MRPFHHKNLKFGPSHDGWGPWGGFCVGLAAAMVGGAEVDASSAVVSAANQVVAGAADARV